MSMSIQTIIIQGIGFAGLALFALSFQIKSNKSLYLAQLLGNCMFGIQFLLLGQLTGCLSLFVLIIRNLLLMHYQECAWVRWKGWIALFSVFFIAILVFTWNGPISILPYLAVQVGTIMYWTNNARNLRLANLFCASPCWLVYDIIVGSIGGFLNESILMISIIVSIYRYGWKNLGQNKFGDDEQKQEDLMKE